MRSDVCFVAGPAAYVHPADAEILDRLRQAELGQEQLSPHLVAVRCTVGERAQRRAHGGRQKKGSYTQVPVVCCVGAAAGVYSGDAQILDESQQAGLGQA